MTLRKTDIVIRTEDRTLPRKNRIHRIAAEALAAAVAGSTIAGAAAPLTAYAYTIENTTISVPQRAENNNAADHSGVDEKAEQYTAPESSHSLDAQQKVENAEKAEAAASEAKENAADAEREAEKAEKAAEEASGAEDRALASREKSDQAADAAEKAEVEAKEHQEEAMQQENAALENTNIVHQQIESSEPGDGVTSAAEAARDAEKQLEKAEKQAEQAEKKVSQVDPADGVESAQEQADRVNQLTGGHNAAVDVLTETEKDEKESAQEKLDDALNTVNSVEKNVSDAHEVLSDARKALKECIEADGQERVDQALKLEELSRKADTVRMDAGENLKSAQEKLNEAIEVLNAELEKRGIATIQEDATGEERAKAKEALQAALEKEQQEAEKANAALQSTDVEDYVRDVNEAADACDTAVKAYNAAVAAANSAMKNISEARKAAENARDATEENHKTAEKSAEQAKEAQEEIRKEQETANKAAEEAGAAAEHVKQSEEETKNHADHAREYADRSLMYYANKVQSQIDAAEKSLEESREALQQAEGNYRDAQASVRLAEQYVKSAEEEYRKKYQEAYDTARKEGEEKWDSMHWYSPGDIGGMLKGKEQFLKEFQAQKAAENAGVQEARSTWDAQKSLLESTRTEEQDALKQRQERQQETQDRELEKAILEAEASGKPETAQWTTPKAEAYADTLQADAGNKNYEKDFVKPSEEEKSSDPLSASLGRTEVPEEVYRSYLRLLSENADETAGTLPGSAGSGMQAGISIGSIGTEDKNRDGLGDVTRQEQAGKLLSTMPVVYYEVDKEGYFTGKYLTDAAQLAPGTRYFVAYSLRSTLNAQDPMAIDGLAGMVNENGGGSALGDGLRMDGLYVTTPGADNGSGKDHSGTENSGKDSSEKDNTEKNTSGKKDSGNAQPYKKDSGSEQRDKKNPENGGAGNSKPEERKPESNGGGSGHSGSPRGNGGGHSGGSGSGRGHHAGGTGRTGGNGNASGPGMDAPVPAVLGAERPAEPAAAGAVTLQLQQEKPEAVLTASRDVRAAATGDAGHMAMYGALTLLSTAMAGTWAGLQKRGRKSKSKK